VDISCFRVSYSFDSHCRSPGSHVVNYRKYRF